MLRRQRDKEENLFSPIHPQFKPFRGSLLSSRGSLPSPRFEVPFRMGPPLPGTAARPVILHPQSILKDEEGGAFQVASW